MNFDDLFDENNQAPAVVNDVAVYLKNSPNGEAVLAQDQTLFLSHVLPNGETALAAFSPESPYSSPVCDLAVNGVHVAVGTLPMIAELLNVLMGQRVAAPF